MGLTNSDKPSSCQLSPLLLLNLINKWPHNIYIRLHVVSLRKISSTLWVIRTNRNSIDWLREEIIIQCKEGGFVCLFVHPLTRVDLHLSQNTSTLRFRMIKEKKKQLWYTLLNIINQSVNIWTEDILPQQGMMIWVDWRYWKDYKGLFYTKQDHINLERESNLEC